MNAIFRGLKKAFVRIGTWLGLIKPEEELSVEERMARRANAKINLALANHADAKSPKLFTTLLLTILFAGAVYVELHLLALFLGLALVCCLISYITIQNWIDIAGEDVDHKKDDPPAWKWPKGEDFAR